MVFALSHSRPLLYVLALCCVMILYQKDYKLRQKLNRIINEDDFEVKDELQLALDRYFQAKDSGIGEKEIAKEVFNVSASTNNNIRVYEMQVENE